jgi:hypothetical protein
VSVTDSVACEGAVRRGRQKGAAFESSSVVCRSYDMLHSTKAKPALERAPVVTSLQIPYDAELKNVTA